MGIIHIDKLKPGMVLDQEVRDIRSQRYQWTTASEEGERNPVLPYTDF
jgi:hypothetical protein